MKRLVPFALLAAAGCLTTVQEKWCDSQTPCSPGFICTSDFHCISVSRPDGGVGGGGGGGGRTGGGGLTGGGVMGGGVTGGGVMGGGVTGGGVMGGGLTGGGLTGGGGGMTGGGGGLCNVQTCSNGCCFNDTCLTVPFQRNELCGIFAEQCRACGFNEGCVMGSCKPIINPVDAGVIGAPCANDTACGNDPQAFCIPETSGGQPTGFVGGYCSRFCEDGFCPGPATCVEAQQGGGNIVHVCLASCMSVVECRPGYQCAQSVCFP